MPTVQTAKSVDKHEWFGLMQSHWARRANTRALCRTFTRGARARDGVKKHACTGEREIYVHMHNANASAGSSLVRIFARRVYSSISRRYIHAPGANISTSLSLFFTIMQSIPLRAAPVYSLFTRLFITVYYYSLLAGARRARGPLSGRRGGEFLKPCPIVFAYYPGGRSSPRARAPFFPGSRCPISRYYPLWWWSRVWWALHRFFFFYGGNYADRSSVAYTFISHVGICTRIRIYGFCQLR